MDCSRQIIPQSPWHCVKIVYCNRIQFNFYRTNVLCQLSYSPINHYTIKKLIVMKYYSRVLTKKALLLFLLILTSKVIFGQLIDFCGTFPTHEASSIDPDSIYWDRFGNSYDIYPVDSLATGSLLNDSCQAGYYMLDFITPLAPGLQNVFCQVFSDLSDFVPRPINIDGCGDTVESDFIHIEIARRSNLGVALMRATSTYANSSLSCPKVVVSNFDLAFFGSENIFSNNIIAGSIEVNSNISNWYTGTGSNAAKYDAYSVILHEALHLMGYSSIFGLWDGPVISKYDSHIHFIPEYIPSGPNEIPIPLFLNDCNSNCWEFNDSIFTDSTSFVNAMISTCSTSGSFDFVFGESILAPLYGGGGIPPMSEKDFRNYMSHLNPTCNGQNEPYVMSPSIDTGIVRDEITSMEMAILCKLGYNINSCDPCFLIVNDNTIQAAKMDLTCCDLILIGCVNDSVVIEFDDLLCNDYSDSIMTIIDFFRRPGTPNVSLNQSSNSISFLPTIQDKYVFEYTVAGCDCQILNGTVEVYVGPCIDCDTIDPCENLVCTNGFKEFAHVNGNASLAYELTGVYWGHLLGDNSVDMCYADSNTYMQIAAFGSNREAISFRLNEPIDSGCIVNISLKASANVSNTYSFFISEFAPCSWSETLVGLGNSINYCEDHIYNPVFLYNLFVDSIASGSNTCPGNPNFGQYSFSIQNNFNFPINFILIEPQQSNNYNFLDDVIITKYCTNSCFNFTASTDCNEISFISCEQDSSYIHSWQFGDDSTSIEINPTHLFVNSGTFEVIHILEDLCGNIDTSQMNIFVSSLAGDCCPDTTISASTTWTGTPPHQGIFHTITVETGVSFTIDGDIELQFCEGGALIIEPGAYVDLEGDLTSYGDMTWKGVYVSGDSSLNQAINLHSGGFHGLKQGYLQTRPGSSIKNAEIGVRNYGKTGSSSSGGMIRCVETLFKNNTIGTDFIEYQNFNDSLQPLPSLGSFTGCRFYTDNDYHLNSPFYAFAQLSDIDGPDFKACKFVNSLLPEHHSQVSDYGFGIHALDSEFKVQPSISGGGLGPCPSPCNLTDSTLFSGLGHGIYVMTKSQARPYSVYHSLFENCFRGITDITWGGSTILFNTFRLGNVPEIIFSYGQIGAEFHFAHSGFTLQENLFIVLGKTKAIPIGLLCNGLGEFDNEIRRNTFDGVETANQAFGINSNNNILFPGGLRYFCNSIKNTPSHGYDFHIPNTELINTIHSFQTPGSSQGGNIASGNHFAYTAQDFINLGLGHVDYYYYPSGYHEEPRDSFSTSILKTQGLANECSPDFCAPPCHIDVDSVKDDFYTHFDDYTTTLDDYLDVLLSENQSKIDSAISKATYYHSRSQRDAFLVMQHLMIDTVGYNTDSLIKWFGNIDTYGSDIMIAGEYAAQNEFVSAIDVLETISSRRDLSIAQENDVTDLINIYSILENKSIMSFTPLDKTLLRNVAYNNGGVASGVARALLSYFKEYVPLPYYAEGRLRFRSTELDSTKIQFPSLDNSKLKIYPNPSTGDIYVTWQEPDFKGVSLSIYNFNGEKELHLTSEFNSPILVNTDKCSKGNHLVVVHSDGGKTLVGKVLFLQN